MAVMLCDACGARVPTRSSFEVECPECGGDLVEEDAYDQEPEELRCIECRTRVQGGREPRGEDDPDRDEFYEGRYAVGDECPICGGELDVPSAGPQSQPEYKLAKAAARNLMRKHGMTELPVDVEALARAEGLDVRYGPYDHEGQLVGDRIEVPIAEGKAAQRFVIAHELGHSHLRHQVASDKIEGEANAFAAELVIPRSELQAATVSRPTLETLRRQFGASKQAMVYALLDARMLDRVARRR